MLMERIMPRKLRGFTLTEAAIVLGIVGLILGAIWVAAAAVYNNLRVSTTSNQLLQIVQSVRSIHATQQTVDTNLAGQAGAVLIARAGGMPQDMVTRDAAGAVTSVTDVWGGAVGIDSATSNGGVAGDSFAVTFNAVPQGACTDLLVRNTGAGRDSGLIGAGAAIANNTAFPLTLTNALGSCGTTGAAGNTVVFTFRLRS